MFGAPALRGAHMVMFFIRRFRDMCQLFKREANFSKPRRDMDSMFSLKVTQDPRLRFRRKKFKKNRLHGFF